MFDLDDVKAQKILESFQVPAKPDVLTELQLEQAKPDPNPKTFSDVIAKDVALSANVLKTINSPVFGLNRTLTDIKQSVILLGTENINLLSSYFLLKQSFEQNTTISLDEYWDTAIQTANMMSIVVNHPSITSECTTEDAYAFGLFRDCGIPLMAIKYGDYKAVLSEIQSSPNSVFTEIEDAHYQNNHAIVGYFAASSWHLPKQLCQLILRHHEPDFLSNADVSELDKTLYALIKVASNALNKYRSLDEDSEWLLSKELVMEYLGLTEFDYEELEADIIEEFSIQFS